MSSWRIVTWRGVPSETLDSWTELYSNKLYATREKVWYTILLWPKLPHTQSWIKNANYKEPKINFSGSLCYKKFVFLVTFRLQLMCVCDNKLQQCSQINSWQSPVATSFTPAALGIIVRLTCGFMLSCTAMTTTTKCKRWFPCFQNTIEDRVMLDMTWTSIRGRSKQTSASPPYVHQLPARTAPGNCGGNFTKNCKINAGVSILHLTSTWLSE